MREKGEMIDRLRRLHELYEPQHTNGRHREEADNADPGADHELAALQQMKQLLERRPARRPEAGTIQAILAAAREAPAPEAHGMNSAAAGTSMAGSFDDASREIEGARADRPPRQRRRSIVLRIGSVSALVAALVAVVTLSQLELISVDLGPSAEDAAIESTSGNESDLAQSKGEPSAGQKREGLTAAPRTEEQSPDAARTGPSPPGAAPDASREVQSPVDGDIEIVAEREPVQLRGMGAPSVSQPERIAEVVEEQLDEQPELTWDARAEMMMVFEHIEMVGDGVAAEWGPPPVPLESLPAGDGDPFYQQVRDGRP